MMKLTDQELELAKTSSYFKQYWGDAKDGLSPEALVAKLRGAKFILDEDASYETAIYRWEDLKSLDIVLQVAKDLSEILGLSTSEYYAILATEKSEIFKRIRK